MRTVALVVLQLLVASVDAQMSAADATAAYCIGLEVDGTADEWESCGARETTLDMAQTGFAGAGTDRLPSALRIRFANDGTNIYVLVQINAGYYFNLTGGNEQSHAISVMWRIGESATMFNMGGCPIPGVQGDAQYDCSAVQTTCTNSQCDCADYLTDVWHMETSSPGALPGVQYPYRGPVLFTNSEGTYSSYGYNAEGLGRYQPAVERLFSGNDHTSNSDDEFSVHPCLRDDDASTKSHLTSYRRTNMYTYRNQLRYAWSHSAINSYEYPFATGNGENGTYTFEFSRPFTTNENTDVQFAMGEDAYYSVALWIPPSIGGEWMAAGHYVAPTNFQFGKVTLQQQQQQQPSGDNGSSSAQAIAGSASIFLLVVLLMLTTA